jgi:gliding motility-associated-like protein
MNLKSLHTTFFAAMLCLSANVYAQVNIKVTITTASSTLDDCDSGVFGIGNSGSDPNYSWTGADIDDRCFEFECTNGSNCSVNGTQNVNKIIYDQSFSCPGGIPASLSWTFRGRENDTPLVSCFPEPPGGSASVQGAIIDVTHSCPLGSVLGTNTYSFTETTTSGCNGTMTYTIRVDITGAFPPAVPDLICDAQMLPIDATYRNYAWCGNYGTETGEFDMMTSGWLSASFGSGWFYFTAPASGSVAIETNSQASSIGTALIVYHAADGVGCGTGHGTSPSGVVLKRKFQYLSSYDDADDDIPLLDPEAQANIDMNSCGILSLADGHDLVAGETYYIQITSDVNNAQGNIAIRVRDLGGSGSNPSDIPCQAQNAGLLTTSNWSTSLNHGCSTSYEFTGNGGTSAYTYLDPTGGSNNINESNWVKFTAPNSGAARVEANVPVLGENVALYTFDARFAPGRPADYSCSNLLQTQYAASTAAIFGGSASIFSAYCLEPGYEYFAMADPTQVSLSSSTNFVLKDPTSSAPANDILCLTLSNPTFNVPVQLSGQPVIAAQNGNNTNACIERLAGEPGFQNAADKTVWHYFTAPASGVVNVKVQAGTIGQVAVAVFPALNGTGCYGGLAPATFTNDGTPTSPRVTALGSVSGAGEVITQVCCLTPGAKYLVEIDGATTISEGTYSIQVQEAAVNAGLTSYIDTDGDTYNALSPTPALICAGESVTASSTSAILPSGGCLGEGFILHNQATPTLPYSMTVYQQATPGNRFFLNNGSAPYNTPIYVSALADNLGNWGDRCPSARIRDAVPVIFLQPIVFAAPLVSACGSVRQQVSGGLPAYNSSTFTYTISPAGSLSTVASGTVVNNGYVLFTATAAGNYTLFITDNEGCQRSTNINIPSVSIVAASVTGSNAICGGTSTTLTATGGATYEWSNAATTPSISVNPSITTTYTVTATNALGCTGTTSKTLNILPAAIAPSIVQTNPLCAIGNGLLNAGNNNYTNWSWSIAPSATVIGTSQTLTVTTPDTYIVTVTNASGCTATDDFVLSANPNPNAPNITSSVTSLCGNSAFAILDATNANYATYRWSNGATTATTVIIAAGTYTVTVTDATGCTATDDFIIQQNAIPAIPTVQQSTNWCPNTTVALTVQNPIATATYNWSNTTSGTSTNVSASGNYTVTITDTGGCTNTAFIRVEPNVLPTTPSIIARDSLCANTAGQLLAGSGYTSYAWTGGDTQPQITINAPGTYTVTVTNQAGCTNTNSMVITRQPAVPAPIFVQTDSLCSNRNATLAATGAGYTQYAWANSNNTTSIIPISAGGIYTITVTNAARCTATATRYVRLNTAPVIPQITIDRYICAGSTGTISVPLGATNYAWSGGSATNTQPNVAAGTLYTVTITDVNTCTRTNNITVAQSATPAVPTITYLGAHCVGGRATLIAASGYETYSWGTPTSTDTLQITNYSQTYTVTVSNTFGCTATNTIQPVANPLPVLQNITASVPLCIDKTTDLTATGGYVSYNWSDAQNGQTVSVNTGGIYTVTVTDDKGCKNTKNITITQENPTLVNIGGGTYYCIGKSLNLETAGTTATYEWNTGAITPNLSISNDGNYTVTATAANGCTGVASITIDEKPLPNANAGADQIVYLGQTAQLQASGTTAGTYAWTTNTTLSNPIIAAPIASPNFTTAYTVVVTDQFGCTASDVVNIEVLDYPDCLKTHEGITPNADGKNDTWQIPCLQYFQNTVQIFNRWGQPVFFANNYNNDFDGIHEGKELVDGTYYYVINIVANGQPKVFKGTVTIIR